MTPQTIKEFRRLRDDFERQASRYSGLKFSVIVLTPGMQARKFEKPNHMITLWQYMGRIGEGGPSPDLAVNDWGMPASKVTAVGLLEGADTEVFMRMAIRGGTLLPDSVQRDLLADLRTAFDEPGPGKPLHVTNGNPLATWLTFLISSMWRNQRNRLRGGTLAVDPFAASLSAIDYLLDDATGAPMPVPGGGRRFDVALSFPGERRDYVAQVATGLRARLAVFYDHFFTAELARPNLDTYLQEIYHRESDLLVVFLSADYERKEWCGLEWRAIRDLIKQREDRRIMLLRFDDADISGLFPIDGYVDLRSRTPEDTVTLVVERLERLREEDGRVAEVRPE